MSGYPGSRRRSLSYHHRDLPQNVNICLRNNAKNRERTKVPAVEASLKHPTPLCASGVARRLVRRESKIHVPTVGKEVRGKRARHWREPWFTPISAILSPHRANLLAQNFRIFWLFDDSDTSSCGVKRTRAGTPVVAVSRYTAVPRYRLAVGEYSCNEEYLMSLSHGFQSVEWRGADEGFST